MTAPVCQVPVRQVTTAAVPEPPPGLFSNCLIVGNTVYLSGQHAGAPGGGLLGDGSPEDQARQALRKLVALVEAAGGAASDIVKLNVFLTDMAHRQAVSAARREFFSEPFPCSTLVGTSALVQPDLVVEIEAVAVIGAGRNGA